MPLRPCASSVKSLLHSLNTVLHWCPACLLINNKYPQDHYGSADEPIAYVLLFKEQPAQDDPKDETEPFYGDHVRHRRKSAILMAERNR